MAYRRHSIAPGIILGTIALIFLVAITVGWNIIFPFYYLESAKGDSESISRAGFWVIMGIGDAFLVTIIVAVALFLATVIKRSRALNRQLTFIDTITHELKTPLTSLALSLETFQRRQLSDEVRESMVKRMEQDVKRLTHFIQHVIAASRIEHGEQNLSIERCDLLTHIRSSRERILERYELAEDCISLDLPDESVLILADVFALESILLNLFDNAVKYSTRDIQISASLMSYEEEYCFAVSDQGIGLSTSDISQLFKRFSRVSNQSNISGSGLGLFLINQLAKRMHMHIRVESEGRGYGSTFYLHIPKQVQT